MTEKHPEPTIKTEILSHLSSDGRQVTLQTNTNNGSDQFKLRINQARPGSERTSLSHKEAKIIGSLLYFYGALSPDLWWGNTPIAADFTSRAAAVAAAAAVLQRLNALHQT